MHFELTEEQELIRRTVREFAEKEIAPHARHVDETGEFPAQTFAKMGRLGLMGLPFPEEYGGAEADTISGAIAVEEVARCCGSTALAYAAHMGLGSAPIAMFGSVEQKRRFLAPAARGEYMAAFGLTEPHAGSDAGATRTSATLDGNEWVINGQKMWITNGSFADVIVVHAVTDKGLGARGGISAFIVEKDAPGFKVGKVEDKMGLKASHTATLYFEDCRVPAENLLGPLGSGFGLAMRTLDIGRCGLGGSSVGAAKEAFELSRKYMVERHQFGRPIADFQALQFKLAEMAVKIYTMEQVVYDCARRVDAGKPATLESSIVKLYCTDMASQVIDEAIQIHGGMGFSRELPLERMYRDARVTRIFEGTNEIQKHVIASELLKQVGHKVKLY